MAGDIQYLALDIYRGDSTGGQEVRYSAPYTPGMVVLDAVRYVQEHDAPDLGVRWNCKAAHCGSCSAEINGYPKLLCKTRVDDLLGAPITIRPMKAFPLIKDLVTDVSWNYDVMKKIPPFKPKTHAPFVMYQRDVDRVQEFHRCIECFLCQDTCHVLREHQAFGQYFGPRFMAKIAEWEMHPMDAADRRDLLHGTGGIALCNVNKCCTEVCPQGIRITDNAIIPLKERVADKYNDPLRRWFLKLTAKGAERSQ